MFMITGSHSAVEFVSPCRSSMVRAPYSSRPAFDGAGMSLVGIDSNP